MNIGVIGQGKVGSALINQLKAEGNTVPLIVRSKTYVYDGRADDRNGMTLKEIMRHCKGIGLEAMFLTISTLDDGDIARSYIQDCVEVGIPVITCEKGALSGHADMLREHLGKIGCTAAVGGGTLMLKYLQYHCLRGSESVDIFGVLNGTLNYIFHQVTFGGRTLGEACQEAKNLGFTEPGADGPLSVIKGELSDIRRKICVLFNVALSRGDFICPAMLGECKLTAEGIEELSQQAAQYRPVVVFSNRGARRSEQFFPGHIDVQVSENWHIQAGFCRVSRDSNFDWLPGGVGNAIMIVPGGEIGSSGKYLLSGPGAGVNATIGAMMCDLHALVD